MPEECEIVQQDKQQRGENRQFSLAYFHLCQDSYPLQKGCFIFEK